MKLDLASAYAASLARVASWAIVAGIIYRVRGEPAFAAFAILRAVMSVIAVTGLGLAPALMILLPQFKVSRIGNQSQSDGRRLDYASRVCPSTVAPDAQLFSTALHIAALACVVGLLISGGLITAKIREFDDGTKFWQYLSQSFELLAAGTLFRVGADVAGSRLQTNGKIAVDNLLQFLTDAVWVVLVVGDAERSRIDLMENMAGSYLAANLVGCAIRSLSAAWTFGRSVFVKPSFRYASLILQTGFVLLLAQVADLLYGPANQAMIKHYLSTEALATYAPLLHIDAALLLGVGGLATLLLPKTAIAMGEQNHAAVRRYYVNGTLASLILLAGGAAFAWAVAPRLFKVWFGDPLPTTVALLPLVMIHTVIGGTAGVGRSILFGMSRAAAYTVASLIGGVANVGLAILLVTRTSLGLRGIIFATIITVVVRCAIWMPWYTLRAIRQESTKFDAERMALAAEPVLP